MNIAALGSNGNPVLRPSAGKGALTSSTLHTESAGVAAAPACGSKDDGKDNEDKAEESTDDNRHAGSKCDGKDDADAGRESTDGAATRQEEERTKPPGESQQTRPRSVSSLRRSGYRGVSKDHTGIRWRAVI